MNNTDASSIIPCTFNYPDINDVTRYVFGSSFILCALLAAIGNTISLVILNKPSMRTKSNRFLTSLAVSDSLVGFLLCPLTAIQLIIPDLLTNCYAEILRVFLSTSLVGISAIMVALVAYDRYLMLSDLSKYYKKMSNFKSKIYILFAWILPAALQLFYMVHGVIYLLVICVLAVGPFVIIVVSYRLMTSTMRKKTAELAAHSKLGSNAQKVERTDRRNLKLARKLVVLVLFYIGCLLPALFNFLAEITIRVLKKEKPASLQTLTVFALFCASVNSVINPAIYVSKYPEFKREFWKLFGRKSRRSSYLSEFSSIFTRRSEKQ
ncbi:high-affinity lysophosphatidic acid receptor-like [Clytia hemisphaerica]|uniref:high-affinity lysophosphatidic acid receptor-like n=1 Tax=Clytia hemisphaerica TaxID=252671 RepID=UPI0034D58F6F